MGACAEDAAPANLVNNGGNSSPIHIFILWIFWPTFKNVMFYGNSYHGWCHRPFILYPTAVLHQYLKIIHNRTSKQKNTNKWKTKPNPSVTNVNVLIYFVFHTNARQIDYDYKCTSHMQSVDMRFENKHIEGETRNTDEIKNRDHN